MLIQKNLVCGGKQISASASSVAFSQLIHWWSRRRLKFYDKDNMTPSVCPNFQTSRDYVASHCLNLPRFVAMKPHGCESAFIRLNV